MDNGTAATTAADLMTAVAAAMVFLGVMLTKMERVLP